MGIVGHNPLFGHGSAFPLIATMDCNREELLANFQACTGIDDVGEALAHLEQTGWNLVEAVNRVIPQDSQVVPPVGDGVQIQELNQPPDVSVGVSVAFGDDPSDPLAEQPVTPLRIMYYGRMLEITLPSSETVSTLKIVLQAQTDMPPCQQDLRLDGQPLSDGTVQLAALPAGQVLTLQQGTIGGGTESDAAGRPGPSTSGLSGPTPPAGTVSHLLTVNDMSTGRQFSMPASATTTVGQIKTDVAALTEWPVSQQSWTGWPEYATDASTLADTGIGTTHTLSVTRLPPPGSAATASSAPPTVDVTSDTSSVEYQDAAEAFDDADDVLFVQEDRPKRVPLVPEDTEDELAGVLHFTEQFEVRYGPCHPSFYQGTLAEAAEEACTKPVNERRMLAIYLHHDGSVLSNVFCSQLLCSESIVSYLTSNFIVWGWDITFSSNQNKFLDRVTAQFGARTREALLMSMDRERLPLLLLLMRSRSSTEVLSAVHGNTSVDELMGTLIHTHDMFGQQMAIEAREEQERRARENMMQEQDRAYQESLLADRAKEEARRAEREEQEKIETAERKERERQESIKQAEEAMRQAVRESLESDLPPEPPEKCDQPITTIRIRSPDGASFCRRFLASDRLLDLLNYVVVQGFPMDQYKLISSWPRRDVSSLDNSASLEALKLCPQETLMLEER
ncbi:FAS-associated factor 1-like isoform X4 [Amphibalanus amphitrite]|uniref:FAS-associated factor 1-like isoform X4 n=1 Tax=Amphibalanus amphitrite TaxID=1232801 RepID=UPI001C90BA75|nr:FAS-associated factor 1-like isoform X4 [Amphibalanus amphitrite]